MHCANVSIYKISIPCHCVAVGALANAGRSRWQAAVLIAPGAAV